MNKSRLEAFSDGVIAFAITIMVLDLKTPAGTALHDVAVFAPVFLGYVLSFIYVGIYWVNHHHLFQVVRAIDGRVLWANLHLLFWISLIPFTTAWVGSTTPSAWPAAFYGMVLLMASCAYALLSRALVRTDSLAPELARLLARNLKGKASMLLYATGVAASFWSPTLAFAVYVIVAAVWFIPDRHFEP